ncbi:MAG TPA: hypothetical protein VIX20_02085 [Ktedonobacteraceae bacterium]
MTGSLAGKEPDSGELKDEPLESVDVNLLEDVKNHHDKLKEICDKLSTSHLLKGGTFLITSSVVQIFIDDIDRIITFFKNNQTKTDAPGLIKDTKALCNTLDDSMSKLNEALLAWSLSESSGLNIKEILQAKGEYQDRLRDCRKLIEEALTFFLVKSENP